MRSVSDFLRLFRERYHTSVDLRRWSAVTAALRSDWPAGKRILISNLHYMYGGSKFEALVAAALRRLGYEPVVVLPAPDRYVEALHNAIGRTEFRYDRDLIGSKELSTARESAAALLRQITDVEQLVAYQVGECRVGRNALSLAIRRLRAGQLDLDDKRHVAAVLEALTTSLARAESYRRLIADVNPARAIFSERGYSPSAELFDACLERHIDAIQWCSAPLDNRLLFKRYRLENRGDHPLTLSSASWDQVRREPWLPEDENRWLDYHGSIYATGGLYNRQRLQDGKAIVGRQDLVDMLELDPNKKVAVIFSHILYDATFFYGENLYPDYLTWLVETVRTAIQNPNLNWVVKVHPVNLWRSQMDGLPMDQLESVALRRAFGHLPPHVKVMTADTPINTYSLFDAIDCGVTVRGTIGLELPCYGIPVVTAGTGRYTGRGFTIDPRTRAEYSDILLRLHNIQRLTRETVTSAQRYAHATLHRRSWLMSGIKIDFDRQDAPIPALRMDLQVTEADPKRLLGPECLGMIATWLDGDREDYLSAGPET